MEHMEHTFHPLSKTVYYTAFFLLLTFLILTHSSESLYYALNGLNLWFTKMIPALFPFMVLSGIVIRLGLTEYFSSILYPLLFPVLRVQKNVCYAIIMGFLCGFPMGARVTCDLLERRKISFTEARFLLAFCNNIGPVYFVSFALPLLSRKLIMPYVIGMYGIPFAYGILLRYTSFRCLSESSNQYMASSSEITVCETPARLGETKASSGLLFQIDGAVQTSIHSIVMLGGYMILFNLFNLLPAFFGELLAKLSPIPQLKDILGSLPTLSAPLLEITGGLSLLGSSHPLYALILLPFGGFSCIAQTYSMIKNTPLSIGEYTRHKLYLSAFTLLYYLIWLFLSPESFLR